MAGATGEVYSFPEGNLYLYASASGTTSGSGVAFVTQATLNTVFGWDNTPDILGRYDDILTGQVATLTVNHLYADRATFNLFNISGAVNARFEGQMTAGAARSALFVLYSGVVDQYSVQQMDGRVWQASLTMHANMWRGFGG